MSKTQSHIPLSTVVVHRDGKNVRAHAGKPFEFTAEEIAHLKGVEKSQNRDILRAPVVEGDAVPKKIANEFAKLVKAAEEALAANKAEPSDKTKKALADAAAAVKAFAEKHDLDVPDNLKDEAL